MKEYNVFLKGKLVHSIFIGNPPEHKTVAEREDAVREDLIKEGHNANITVMEGYSHD